MSDVISIDNDVSANIAPISKETVSKFLKQFFRDYGCSIASQDGINVAIIPIKDGNSTNTISDINLSMYKQYNLFLQNTYNKDPKFFDRSMTYESEVKDNNLFIRWV